MTSISRIAKAADPTGGIPDHIPEGNLDHNAINRISRTGRHG